MRLAVGLAAVVSVTACGGVAAGTLQLKVNDEVKVRVSPEGAVVMNKQRVATIDDKGKVIGSDGKVIAWVFAESIRFPGGAQIPIKTDDKGNLYLPRSAQQNAGINMVRTRVGAGGTVVTKDGSGTNFVIEGAGDLESRRVGLLMLVLLANPPAALESTPPGDGDGDGDGDGGEDEPSFDIEEDEE